MASVYKSYQSCATKGEQTRFGAVSEANGKASFQMTCADTFMNDVTLKLATIAYNEW